jgi:MFS superfamily sulfate permease-like transporter
LSPRLERARRAVSRVRAGGRREPDDARRFVDFAELARLARLRGSAILLALLALAGVLVRGVLPGLLIAAGLSLIIVIQRLSRERGQRQGPYPRARARERSTAGRRRARAVRERGP